MACALCALTAGICGVVATAQYSRGYSGYPFHAPWLATFVAQWPTLVPPLVVTGCAIGIVLHVNGSQSLVALAMRALLWLALLAYSVEVALGIAIGLYQGLVPADFYVFAAGLVAGVLAAAFSLRVPPVPRGGRQS